jgi:hypothetical protein
MDLFGFSQLLDLGFSGLRILSFSLGLDFELVFGFRWTDLNWFSQDLVWFFKAWFSTGTGFGSDI